ncbi:MAG: hypothetical protein M1822_005428 [Bathelium mastoideum]|nr:MAG: hypothetical protein M1822_005428 [Bathelium mastoideum]
MASTAAIATPERGASAVPRGVRRSFTEPTKVVQAQTRAFSTPQHPSGTVETLYTHPGARIVSFNTPSRAAAQPWGSTDEKIVTAGPFHIDRVPGSVSFLRYGNSFKPLLPKYPCWFVDQESTFVYRAGEKSYYRIELPNNTDFAKEKIEEIKSILGQVLSYERKPSPFRGDCSHDEREDPETPTPRTRSNPTQRARRWKHDRVWQPAEFDGIRAVPSDLSNADFSDSDASISASTNSSTGTGVESDKASAMSGTDLADPDPIDIKPLARPQTITAMRSITAPPQLSLQASLLSKTNRHDDEAPSLPSSLDSFHSVSSQVYHPADDNVRPCVDETEEEQTPMLAPPHSRQISDITVTAEAYDMGKPIGILSPLDDDLEGSVPSTPTLLSDTEEHPDQQSTEIATPPDTLRLRHSGKARYRPVSPFPHDSSTTLLMQARPHNQHLPGMIVRKTFEILTSPPSHLVSLMLRIAARIAGSIGLAVTDWQPSPPNRLPCSWESEEEGIDWDEEEDCTFRLKPLEHSLTRDPD